MTAKKLNDTQIRFLRKIFITWLKKEGYYEDYINAKMYLKMHPLLPPDPYSDGWPHSLNESKIFYTYHSYSNIIDATIDYHRCRDIRNDWGDINKKWCDFIDSHYILIVNSFYNNNEEKIDKEKIDAVPF